MEGTAKCEGGWVKKGLGEVFQGYKDLTLLAGRTGDGVFFLRGDSPPSSACWWS